MEIIKTAIASFGMSGEIFHAPLLHSHDKFEIVKILERTKQKSREKYPYAQICRTYAEITEDPSIDLVIINTPDMYHHDMTLDALQAGKHVVVEKPVTLKVSEADDLIREANKAKKMLAVFQNRRWDGDFLTVKKIIDEGLLGRLVEFEAHFDRYRNYTQDTWKESPDSGTGTIYNLGSHLIDQALVLFGLPESVFADIRALRTGAEVDDSFKLLLKYSDVKVTLNASYLVREPGPRYYLHGTLGSFLKWGVDPQEEDLKAGIFPGVPGWGTERPEDWGILNTEINGLHFEGAVETIPGSYLAFYDDIYEAISKGKKPAVTGEQGRDVIRVIEAAKESSRTGKAVKL